MLYQLTQAVCVADRLQDKICHAVDAMCYKSVAVLRSSNRSGPSVRHSCPAGGSHISEDPTAVRSALQKLLNLPAPHLGSGSTGLSAEGSPGSFQEKIVLVIPTQHLFAWIDKHKEVLQKLLSEGEAFAASHRSGIMTK